MTIAAVRVCSFSLLCDRDPRDIDSLLDPEKKTLWSHFYDNNLRYLGESYTSFYMVPKVHVSFKYIEIINIIAGRVIFENEKFRLIPRLCPNCTEESDLLTVQIGKHPKTTLNQLPFVESDVAAIVTALTNLNIMVPRRFATTLYGLLYQGQIIKIDSTVEFNSKLEDVEHSLWAGARLLGDYAKEKFETLSNYLASSKDRDQLPHQ
ncbi:MAG: hypothetical protein H7A37_00965 [Chlamydiales bacterium]|nr:hypothetical protein [Chlamydiia bacterium]MCP5506864.1 hypothetical protein [Chlamydiales bacterium]